MDSHALSRVAALIPVRGLEGSKSRLGEALDAEERRGLVERLLRTNIRAAAAVRAIHRVAVVSADPAARELAAGLGATPLAEPVGDIGLNGALAAAAAWASTLDSDAILVLPADLPAMSVREIERVLATVPGSRGGVVLVPDRAGTGTNVLLVAPPGAIPFCFGAGSRAAHAAAAAHAGIAFAECFGPLTLDIDTPDDLLAAEAAGLVSPLRETLP